MAKQKRFVKVCSCTPKGSIQTMDSRVLNLLVEEYEATIGRESNPRKMAQRALELGDACVAAGCPMKAIKVWREAARRLEAMDYRWVAEPINPSFVRFDDLVSAKEAVTLGRRVDKVWCLLGHPEMAVWARRMKHAYEEMWMDKYYMALP